MNNADLIYGTGKYERKPMDFYPTPADVTHALIDHLEKHLMIGEGSVVLEPACGDGHMSEVIKERGYYVRSTDIRHTGYADWNEGGGHRLHRTGMVRRIGLDYHESSVQRVRGVHPQVFDV